MDKKTIRHYYFGLLLAMLLPCLVNAQPSSFIHLQSENSKGYTVVFNGNTYISSETGYLLIPKVTSGDILFEVSFPTNPKERFRFECKMQDKPRGFTLKQGLDNGWSLFDMVSFDEMKALRVQELSQKQEVAEPLIPDISTKPTLPEVSKINAAVTTTAVSTAAVVPVISKPKAQIVVSDIFIQKIFDKTGSTGIDQVYIIHEKGNADTIALFIPTLKLSETKQTASRKDKLDQRTFTENNTLKAWGRIQYAAIKNPVN
jgi:hypothetical protein